MVSQRITISIICLFASYFLAAAQEVMSPYRLMVNMLIDTEQVFLNGYPVNTPLEEAVTYRENWQFTDISTARPVFGWMFPSDSANTRQIAYRILVASGKELLARDAADLWDNYGRESQFSDLARFKMADELVDYATDVLTCSIVSVALPTPSRK